MKYSFLYLSIFLLANGNGIYSFYLPGLAPVNYCQKGSAGESESCKVIYNPNYILLLNSKALTYKENY